MQPEKTEYAEIASYLRGRFRPLNGPDDQAYAHVNTLSSGSTREEFVTASTLPDAVTNFLVQLDAKMDTILAALFSSSLERDFPHEMEVLSISAAKLTFTTDLPLAKGDCLEVVISLREMGVMTAAGIGSVTKRESGKDGTPVFSFSFTRIREEEREKIIRHVFKEERRLLRETRLD